MRLHELQTALQAHILSGHGAILGEIEGAGQAGLGAMDRLGIYREGYRLRLIEVMQDHFTQTLAYLGDALFDSEALAYIEAHPSASPSLRDFGQHWPRWLAERYPADLDMAELAQLEWSLRRAFDEADSPVLGMAALATIPAEGWEHLRLGLHASAQMLAFTCNVIELWQALSQGTAPPAVASGSSTVLVWRQGWQPHFRTLDEAEAAALRALARGDTFGQLCAQSPGLGAAGQAETAGRWLARWINDGLIASQHPG